MGMIDWWGKIKPSLSMGVVLTLNFNCDVCHCFYVDEHEGFAIPNVAQATPFDWTLNFSPPLVVTLNLGP